MSTEMVNVKVDLTVEDVYNFQKSFLLRKFPLITWIILSILLVVCAIFLLFNNDDLLLKVVRTIILLAIPVIIFVVVPFFLKRTSKTMLETSKPLQKTQNYLVSDEGIEITSESGRGFIKWNELYKAIESNDSFQFYASNRQAYIVPKKCLDITSGQIEMFRSFIKFAPIPKEEKRPFIKRLWLGLIIYIILFFAILIILTIYQANY